MLCSSIKVNSINNCANSKITVLIPFAFESEESPSERERHSWYGISVLKMCCLSQTTAHYHLKWAIIIVGSSKWVLSLVGALTAIFIVFVSVLHLLLNRWVDEKKKQLRLLVLVRLRRNTCQSLCPKMIVYKHLAEAVSRAASMSVLSFAKRILFWIPLFVCSFSSPLRNTQQPWRALAGFLPLSLSLSVALLQNTTGWNCAERGCTNNVVNFTLWSLKCYSFSN